MINYIIQVLLFQALFLAVYDFFLQKETFFKWNRVYLLATPFISFIIPLIKFDKIQQAVPQEYIVQMPTVFLNPEALIIGTNTTDTSIDYLAFIFYLGIIVFSSFFLIRLFKILKLITSNDIIKENIYSLVLLKSKQSAFSFFNYIFINKKLLENKELEIIQHELVHCRQKHSIDLLIFELLKIVLWFNPLIYVYQKRITLLHEYISDAEVVKETDKKTYFNRLLAETFSVDNISFTNQFFKHSLIKKRIVMITKERSQKMKQLKYLLIVPLLFGMLIYSSCSDDIQTDIENVEKALKEENIPSEGKYFRAKNGFILFTGTHLAGEVILREEYSEKEKEVFDKFSAKNDLELTFSIVIDENGERVFFIKTKKPFKESNNVTIEDDESVPFAIIEEVPVYPGCEGSIGEMRSCLQEKITKHVSENFNADLASDLGLSPGVKRIFVMFKIDKEGNVADVQARAPHKDLQQEAIRVINLLPKMIPGKQKGADVGVKYSLPIAFKVGGDAKKKVLIKNEQKLEEWNDIPFAVIDEVPVYPGCEGTKEELRKCIQDKITKHVSINFDSKKMNSINLGTGLKRIFVMFKIDKGGDISEVKSRASHKSLQEEAIRVINLLPKMIPGKQKGKPVGVKYSLPIAFKVE